MLARLVVPFLAGVTLPVALFLVPYARAGALGAFANGVFVLPMRRFDLAHYPALPLTTMLALVPIALLGRESGTRTHPAPSLDSTEFPPDSPSTSRRAAAAVAADRGPGTHRGTPIRLLNRGLVAALVINAGGNFAAGTYDVIWSLFLQGLGAGLGLIGLTFAIFGLPILVAAVFAMWTYKRITVDQQPGSVIGYIISTILLLTFGLVPMVRFAPGDLAAVQDSEVVRTVARINDSLPVDAIGDPATSSVPLAPALLLIAAVDLSEAIGRSINREPVGSEMSKIILAARSAQLW